jgi:hypothetical protein
MITQSSATEEANARAERFAEETTRISEIADRSVLYMIILSSATEEANASAKREVYDRIVDLDPDPHGCVRSKWRRVGSKCRPGGSVGQWSQIRITLMKTRIRIRIRILIELKSRIRIRIKVKSWIRIRSRIKEVDDVLTRPICAPPIKGTTGPYNMNNLTYFSGLRSK